MLIRYYTKCTFGRDKNFPLDCVEELMCITRTKCIEDTQIEAFKALGVEFEQVLPPKKGE